MDAREIGVLYDRGIITREEARNLAGVFTDMDASIITGCPNPERISVITGKCPGCPHVCTRRA